MSCKFPEGNRSYKFCLGCGDKLFCDESTLKTDVEMPSVTLPNDVIPSASKANEMTNHAIDNCVAQQLLELSGIIKNAIANGKFSIDEEGFIYPGARKILVIKLRLATNITNHITTLVGRKRNKSGY